MTEHLTLLVSLFFVGTLGLSYGRIITVLFESREAALNFGPELTLSPRRPAVLRVVATARESARLGLTVMLTLRGRTPRRCAAGLRVGLRVSQALARAAGSWPCLGNGCRLTYWPALLGASPGPPHEGGRGAVGTPERQPEPARRRVSVLNGQRAVIPSITGRVRRQSCAV